VQDEKRVMGRSTQRAHELRVNRETDHLPLPLLFTQARYRSGGKNWVLWLSSTQGTYSLFSSCQENLFCLISLAHAVILCVASLPHAAVARASTVPPPRSCLRPRPPHRTTTSHMSPPPPCSRFQSRPISVARQSYLIF
jgi:hypothetical protein